MAGDQEKASITAGGVQQPGRRILRGRRRCAGGETADINGGQ
jgi:hypothetical protein